MTHTQRFTSVVNMQIDILSDPEHYITLKSAINISPARFWQREQKRHDWRSVVKEFYLEPKETLFCLLEDKAFNFSAFQEICFHFSLLSFIPTPTLCDLFGILSLDQCSNVHNTICTVRKK